MRTTSRRIILLLLLAACAKDEPDARQEPDEAAVAMVRTAVVEHQAWERCIEVVGRLEPMESATLAAKVPGRLQHLFVDVGSQVGAGERIAQLEEADYALRLELVEAALVQVRIRVGLAPDVEGGVPDEDADPAVREARAVLVRTEADLARARQLHEQGVSSESEYDLARAEHEIARARLAAASEDFRVAVALLRQRRAERELARRQLADCALLAPFGGVIAERQAAPGDFLAAGDPVAVLVRVDPLRLRAEVPEREAAGVVIGQEVRVWREGAAAPERSQVARLSPLVRDRDRIVIVESELANPGQFPQLLLQPGAFVSVEIVTDPRQEALSLPLDAVISFAGLDKVFVVEDGAAVERRVRLGRRDGERAEVLDGMMEGERVVLQPGALRSRQPVRWE